MYNKMKLSFNLKLKNVTKVHGVCVCVCDIVYRVLLQGTKLN